MSLNLDKTTWRRVKFGDVVKNVADRVQPDESGANRYVGLEHLDPGVMTVQRWASPDVVESQKLRFQSGDVIFGRRRAYQKKVARADFDGICSAHALVLRAIPGKVHPDFLPIFLSSDYFLDRAVNISVGSLSPTVNWRDLKVQEFDLPPVDVQQRLADLLWAVERDRKSLHGVRMALAMVKDRYVGTQLRKMDDYVQLGSISTSRSGPSYAATQVSQAPSPARTPVLGITNTRPDGSIDLTEVSYVSGLPATVRTIDETSLVLIRTNGNHERVGNVYLPPPEAHGYAVSAFQFLMCLNDPLDRAYLYTVLSHSSFQRQMTDAVAGSTGLGNLAVAWLNSVLIPWSQDRAARDSLDRSVASIVASQELHENADEHRNQLRASLLHEIFGG